MKEHIAKVALGPQRSAKIRELIDQWEKEEERGGQSLALELNNQIKDTKEKLDKLVNAFLDNTIDKDVYLVKKEELLTLKAALTEKKANLAKGLMRRNEPLREWLNLCIHADKLASSKDFNEIKSVAEKIGSNPRLLNRTVEFEYARPFDLIPQYKGFDEGAMLTAERHVLSETGKNRLSLIISGALRASRTRMTNIKVLLPGKTGEFYHRR